MTTRPLILACAQLNPHVGDIDGNADRLRDAWARAEALGAHLLLPPEMVLSGYPAEDLVRKPDFMRAIEAAVEDLRRESRGRPCAALVTTPWVVAGRLENAALLLDDGEIVATVTKQCLPNYGVFDEMRVFSAGAACGPVAFRGVHLGLLLCEDAWQAGVAAELKARGAQVLLALNASPYSEHKRDARLAVARRRVAETGLPLAYVNLVGGQDELVFDGAGFALDRHGAIAARLPAWQESLDLLTLSADAARPWDGDATQAPAAWPEGPADLYAGMVQGLRDYVHKNGFPGVLLGLSGGIDSAVVAVAAADALGPERVIAVALPSRYTSAESLEDAGAMARALGIRLLNVPIEPAHAAFEGLLARSLGEPLADLTGQNLQARSRGVLLMALSNQLGHMLLTTGNKSEMATGYATLYGDMCGGFNPLKDLYKTQVYAVARWRNQARPALALGPEGATIPERVLTKAPTAELKPGQTDQDNLPPYEMLDAILQGLVEEERPLPELAARGFAPETVRRVWTLLERAEYKRRQAPPGVKLSERALSRERRYPITNGFRVHAHGIGPHDAPAQEVQQPAEA